MAAQVRVSPLVRSFSTRLVYFCPRSSSSERAPGPLTVCCWSSLAGGWSAATPPGRRLTLKVTPIYVLNVIRHCKYTQTNQNKNTGHVCNGGAALIFTKLQANMRTTALSLTLYHSGRRPRATRLHNSGTLFFEEKRLHLQCIVLKIKETMCL